MVFINAAATVPINPAGASPVLTRAQVWAGLLIKCRQPHRFIPVMQDCTVTKETAAEMVRVVKFQPGLSPLGGDEGVEEVLRLMTGVKVDFRTTKNGTMVSNIIGGGHGGDEDMHLTFTFEFNFPNIADADSAEAKEQQQKLFAGGLTTVQHTVDVCREFVVSGEVKA